MAGPYLKSGESIVLTTDRVLIDDMEYDLILTTQRLALVDSDHTSDQPRVVPFATIISVKGGLTPAREPVITLTVTDPALNDETRTLDLIFSQQPYQDRSAECDLWVKKLIEHIVSVRQEPRPAGKSPAPEPARGIHPSIRRFIAPDVPLPHTEVTENRRPSEELLQAMQGTSWESQDTTADTQVADELQVPEPHEEPGLEKETLPPAPQPVSMEAPAAPEPEKPPILEVPDQNNPAPADTSTSHSNEPVTEEKTIAAEEGETQKTAPAMPFSELVPEQSGDAEIEQADDQPAKTPPGPVIDMEEISRQIENVVPVTAEDLPEFGPDIREPIGIPESVIFPVLSGPVPDNRPATTPSSTAQDHGEPATGEPIRAPGRSHAVTFSAIAIAILVIIGVVMLVSFLPAWENPAGSDHTVVTPLTTPLPAITVIPVTIPPGGVWLKVSYNGTYYGKYGNPGSLVEVRGSGDQIYAIKNSNDLVQASFRKLDYSGNNMTLEVYNDGTMITRVFKNTPAGEIDILVNSTTGRPPFVPVTTTIA